MIFDGAALSLDHFTTWVLHALHSFLLVIGVICLLLGADRFKKRSERAAQATYSIVAIYTVFGLGLIILYFSL